MFSISVEFDDKENRVRGNSAPPKARGKPTGGKAQARSVSPRRRSVEQQQRVLAAWVNHVLADSSSTPAPPSAPAPLDEAEALGRVLDRSSECAVHRRALALAGGGFADSIAALGRELEQGRVRVREDRCLLADLELRESLHEILFSYELPWLRLGLEIVFEGFISPPRESHAPACWKPLLKAFIADKLLSSEDIVGKYSKYAVMTASGERALKAELSRHLVLKALSVVLFLDLARTERLLRAPTLFRRDAPVKSTRDALSLLARTCLRAEGDLVKRLGGLGFRPSFAQRFVHEFDYRVSDLATDMRDGLRLAKLVEVLTAQEGLLDQLRVPAISRLQKLFNVNVTLARLRVRKGSVDKGIVDGAADATAMALWRILSEFSLKPLLAPKAVLLEAIRVRANARWRTAYPIEGTHRASEQAPNRAAGGAVNRGYSYLAMAASAEETDLRGALVEWCDSIASQFGLSALNLGADLADGRALCLIVHYYHPTLLPAALIASTSRDAAARPDDCKRAAQSERRNFALLGRVCAAIGGMPFAMPLCDATAPPDETVAEAFLCFLFARITESSKQVLACIRIQRFVRLRLPGGLQIQPAREGLAQRAAAPVVRADRKRAFPFHNKQKEPSYTLALSKKQLSTERIIRFLRRAAKKRRDSTRAKRASQQTTPPRSAARGSRSSQLTAQLTIKTAVVRFWRRKSALRIFRAACLIQASARRYLSTRATSARAAWPKSVAPCLRRFLLRVISVSKSRSLALRVVKVQVRFPFLRELCGRLILFCQALYRGHRSRRETGKSLVAIRDRVILANLNAAQQLVPTLQQKTVLSLLAIQEDSSIKACLEACEMLERSTALSRDCCEYLAFSSASISLFRIIRSCSRSAAHQDLLM